MFWETLWALVLGFTLSGAVQAFVSRTEMQQALGDHASKTLAESSSFGMISSSCSYALFGWMAVMAFVFYPAPHHLHPDTPTPRCTGS